MLIFLWRRRLPIVFLLFEVVWLAESKHPLKEVCLLKLLNAYHMAIQLQRHRSSKFMLH